jgi:hypothetical protein
MPRDGVVGSVSFGDQQLQFGVDVWKKLNAAGGDFSVIGLHLKKDRPVKGFELIQAQNEELSRKAQIQQAEQAGAR